MASPENDTSEHPRWAAAIALLLPVVCLLPFVNKAFHIDDTVYLWVAQQIHQDPVNFFGFMMNWSDRDEWLYEFNKNPPGISYLLAAAALVVGWNEIGLHLIFLIPPALASLGIYFLAREMCARPLLATAVAVLSPVFIVSSTNLMCEPTMLAFYVWSVFLWMRGLESRNPWLFIAAGALMGFGGLVKYLVVSVIPLMFVYTLLHQRRPTRTLLYFLVPAVILLAYDMITLFLYDTSVLRSAVDFAMDFAASRQGSAPIRMALMNVSFMGGCFVGSFLLAPLLWSWRRVVALCAMYPVVVLLLVSYGGLTTSYLMYEGTQIRWGYLLQLALFLTAGFHLFGMLLAEVWAKRDKESMLLLMWIAGIFLFGAFVNWTINARALLPMAPPIGILVARRFDLRHTTPINPIRVAIPLCAGTAIALAVAWGDYRFAETGRLAAREAAALQNLPGTTWFQGHWGFQYYMEELGHRPVDMRHFHTYGEIHAAERKFKMTDIGIYPGDRVVDPENDANFRMGGEDEGAYITRTLSIPTSRWVTTMNQELGAGFYSFAYGPLPYYFGKVPAEQYKFYDIREPSASPDIR